MNRQLPAGRAEQPAMLKRIVLLLLLVTASAQAAGKKPVEGVVNLNTATAEELQLLPGIGPAKVQTILSYRKARPFKTVEELVRIKGIGRAMMKKLHAHLAVSGPTTLHVVGAGR